MISVSLKKDITYSVKIIMLKMALILLFIILVSSSILYLYSCLPRSVSKILFYLVKFLINEDKLKYTKTFKALKLIKIHYMTSILLVRKSVAAPSYGSGGGGVGVHINQPNSLVLSCLLLIVSLAD